jgi:hypothetical protein
MELKKLNIFQIDAPEVKEIYSNDNYLIEYNKDDCDQNLCVVYFSSHNLYYPNTTFEFHQSIIKSNKFEWKNNKFSNAKKHIFIRDIHKQWYISGISAKIDNPYKLIDFLLQETRNFETYTIGSSAGGYAAILFGSILKVKRVYAFNPQINLNIILKTSNPIIDPLIFKYSNDSQFNIFYDLNNYLINLTECHYFLSNKSKVDLIQYNNISREARHKINLISFNNYLHGIPFFKINISYILSLNKNQLLYLSNKVHYPILFSIQINGLINTIYFIIKSFLKIIKIKIKIWIITIFNQK